VIGIIGLINGGYSNLGIPIANISYFLPSCMY